MIALETNLLVYSHRGESPWHARTREAIGRLIDERMRCAIPWPCVYEFLSVVTHPRIHKTPSRLDDAVAHIESLLANPMASLIGETDDHLAFLRDFLTSGHIVGPLVHDAKIAAICLSHGVTELWTADRDFSRFPKLKIRNPLV